MNFVQCKTAGTSLSSGTSLFSDIIKFDRDYAFFIAK
jgi:hypothetical protein